MKQGSKQTPRGPARGKLARDRVCEVAADLFYRKGLHAVGVEEIVKEAGVAKISLYRSFASKDDLIVTYLDERGKTFLRDWDDAFERYRDDPRAQLRAIMTSIAERTTSDGYRGCPFINFCAEYPELSHGGHEVARAIKRALQERFLRLAKALRARNPAKLADAFLLLVEGAYAISQTLGGGDEGVGHSIVWTSEILVEAELNAFRPSTSRANQGA